MSSEAVLQIVRRLGVDVKNHMSTLLPETVARVQAEMAQERTAVREEMTRQHEHEVQRAREERARAAATTQATPAAAPGAPRGAPPAGGASGGHAPGHASLRVIGASRRAVGDGDVGRQGGALERRGGLGAGQSTGAVGEDHVAGLQHVAVPGADRRGGDRGQLGHVGDRRAGGHGPVDRVQLLGGSRLVPAQLRVPPGPCCRRRTRRPESPGDRA